MAVTRKQFIGLVATGVAGAAAWSPGRLLAETVQSGYSPETFSPYVGDTFHVTNVSDDKSVKPVDSFDVTLASVSNLASGSSTVQFSLEFTGPAGDAVPSGRYLFVHPKLGSIPMFVGSPLRDGQGRPLYRADFNILQNTRSTVIAPSRPRR
jgi:hypothetical protein